MNLLLKRNLRIFLRNIVVVVILFNFGFLSSAPTVSAQTQPLQPSQTAVQPSQVPQTTTPGQQTVILPDGATETGYVQGACDVVESIPGVGGFFGKGCNLAQEIVGTLFSFMMGKLIEILAKIITYIMHILAAVLGLDTSQSCDPGSAGFAECDKAIKAIAQIDPLFSPDAKINFNAFTLMDQSYNTLYASLPVVNPIEEVSYIARNNILGIGNVNAQGEGTTDLGDTVRSLWQKMRDLAYIGTVLILITIGFMVMLRRRLDPKTVVTATNSLPRVAIALILITFSFAISGLFIDLIYVLVNLTRNYFGDISTYSSFLDKTKAFGGELTVLPFLTFFSRPIINWGVFIPALVASGLVAAVSAVFTLGLSLLVILIPVIAALGFELIIRIGLFILSIMLFWSLLMRFVTLIVLTVFSPFFFLVGALPGFEGITINWFKRMASAMLAFPAILIIVYLALALLSPLNSLSPFGIGPQDVQAPPPLGAAKSFLNIAPLIGLGILYLAHKIPGMIDEAIGIKDTKQRGPTPLILLSGALAGGQTISTISKAAPTIGGWASGMAGVGGPVGWIGGGLTRAFGAFSPDVNGPIRNAAQQVRQFSASDFAAKGKKPSDFNAKLIEGGPPNAEPKYVMNRLDYARYQRYEPPGPTKSKGTEPKETRLTPSRIPTEDLPTPEPITRTTPTGTKLTSVPRDPDETPVDPNLK